MAKGQKRSNKEIRKPKQAKPAVSGASMMAKGLGLKWSDF